MKKIYFLNLFILITIISGFIRAQDLAPLQLSNIWVYDYGDGVLGRAEVVDSSFFIDSVKYFGIAEGYTGNDRALRLTEENYFVMREDSTFPEPNNERKYYKKDAQLGDTWTVDYGGAYPAVYTITDTFPAYTFDTLVTGKLLNENFGLVEWDYVWTEEFGMLSKFDWQGELQYYLKGCVINGKVYGDTTFIVSSVNETYLKLTYSLSNNYPNPFNSSTIINFTIPENDYVSLEVYTILGEKVKTLINKFIYAGNHSIRFVADNLASGTYLYILRTTKFSKSKKMLLIK